MKRAITLTGTIQYASLKSTSPVDMFTVRTRLAGRTSGKAVCGYIMGLRIDAINWLQGSHKFSLAQLGSGLLASQTQRDPNETDGYRKAHQNRPSLETEPNSTSRSGGRSHLANSLTAMPT